MGGESFENSQKEMQSVFPSSGWRGSESALVLTADNNLTTYHNMAVIKCSRRSGGSKPETKQGATLFPMNETQEYLGLLIGQHVSIGVATSHAAATYLIDAFLSPNFLQSNNTTSERKSWVAN